MRESKYLQAFLRLGSEAKDGFELVGDNILVEHIFEGNVKRSSGLELPTSSTNNDNWKNAVSQDKPVWVRVLYVGKGYYDDETGETVPLNCHPGDICLVGRQSTKWFTVFGDVLDYELNSIGLTRESEIQARFVAGDENYAKVFSILNAELKSKNGPDKANL